jgi:mannose-6-phosphate isomerase-like protein (cupin superfamily)
MCSHEHIRARSWQATIIHNDRLCEWFHLPMSTPNVNEVRSSWLSRGFSCAVWTDPPGQMWEDYQHDIDELVMVLEGDVEFEFCGKAVRPAPGTELLIPAGELHSVRNRGNSTSRWLYGSKRIDGP